MTLAQELTQILVDMIYALAVSFLEILAGVIALSIGLLVFYWGKANFQDAVLGYMHSHTETFQRMPGFAQRAWSWYDRKYSRKQIMRMEGM